jgi:LCP family protein required for cell wall assembly
MTQPRHNTDGFVPRRPGDQLGGGHDRKSSTEALTKRVLGSSPAAASSSQGIGRADISESLKGIDAIGEPEKGKKRGRKGKKPQSRRRRIIKWTLIALSVAALAVAGWVAYKALHATGNVFKGNPLDIIKNQPLKEDKNGRSNILLLGTSEDDPGHGGAYLTDSMMVISINQKNKDVAMFSIPRDLYVQYGMACNSGYEGKINEYFNCVNSDWNSKPAEEERMTKTRQFVGDIFGMDIQYGVHVNNTVIKEAVNAVGGVDVDIQGSGGASGVLDRNFDWRCNYQCYYVKYDNGVHHLDGEHALYLAMARGDVAPTYGLGNSNFDREKNQQKIIIALKKKAVSSGTLSNVSKVTKLIDALGNNLRTNFQTKEIRTLVQLGKDIKPENIKTVSLFDSDNQLVTTSNYGGQSVVIPSAGAFNYSEIRAYLEKKLSSNPVVREGAHVVVMNGSDTSGLAQIEADKLSAKGFTISGVDNAPEGTYDDVEIYQIGDGMTATAAKLKSMFGVEIKKSTPPVSVADGTNFVIIFGKASSKN